MGIPVAGLPDRGDSSFTFNTAYMVSACVVNGFAVDGIGGTSASLKVYSGWSGANHAISPSDDRPAGYPYVPQWGYSTTAPLNVTFRSVAVYTDGQATEPLTVAQCNLTTSFVEVMVACEGRACQATAVRPSSDPSRHESFRQPNANLSSLLNPQTPLNGLGQASVDFPHFWPEFTNATNPNVGL